MISSTPTLESPLLESACAMASEALPDASSAMVMAVVKVFRLICIVEFIAALRFDGVFIDRCFLVPVYWNAHTVPAWKLR
jgi:hypothetical protein